MAEPSPPQPVSASGGGPLLFSYRGRIDRKKYWIGIVAVLASLVAAVAFGAQAMNPTGASSVVLLGLPFAVLAIWIHSAVTAKRLRDAGFSGWGLLLYAASPAIWLAATLELIEYIGFLIGIVFLALLMIPGFLPSKPASA